MITPTWDDEFELLDNTYSLSDLQDHIEYIIKNTKYFPTIFYSYLHEQD